MILFHTSDRIIKMPDIHIGRSNADFGRGFYLTPDESFAGNWARERTASDIYVNKYELCTVQYGDSPSLINAGDHQRA